MSVPVKSVFSKNLVQLGLQGVEGIHYQSSPEELMQDAIRIGEGVISDSGALVVKTGKFTGRSPKDKYIVKDEITENTVDWNEFNNPLEPQYFDVIYKKMMDYLEQCPELWIRDCYACANPHYRLHIRVTSEKPWTDLFVYNMFLHPKTDTLENFKPEWNIFVAPGLHLNPAETGTRSANASVVSFKHKTILIAGSGYTGETKKGIFTILNFILPQLNVLSMHCSANMGADGDTAIFFGLSGTGKTTLSADPNRRLIGDDEHGWADNSIFNFEGGCYAKVINLSPENEPQIFSAIRSGALLENVTLHPNSNNVDFNDTSITENTRVSYPLHFIENALEPPVGDVPQNIFFLTCDAFGVLPPIAQLTPEQAMYQFISGYTAKIAGTEAGVTEPKPTFSACFGAPFLPLHPGKYAAMLGEKIKQNNVSVWLVNTGWIGGPYGTGQRIKLSYTRAMITAALNGQLQTVATEPHPVFGVAMPVQCPNVPAEILNPENTWANKEAYYEKAKFLATLFTENFQQYASGVTPEIQQAAPNV